MVDRVKLQDLTQSFSSLEASAKEKENPSFSTLLKNYLKNVDMDQHYADKAIEDFLAGKRDIQQVVLTVEKADISFRLFMKIREKLLEAYQEIMRMQV